ncbi:MAG TPA: dihydropteroate synthase [Polyangiaceae bacterium]|nr:dihydropteroate synthase [Polyangiaceae bacterium]
MGVPSEWLDRLCTERGAALMGVLNVTPDSFYDGGRYVGADAARVQVDRLLAEGAAIIDVGAESSRPGAESVPASEQLERLDAALRHAVARGALVSIDTTSPEVAERALALGARLVNDVSCLAEPELARVTARAGATLVLMHARGPMSAQRGFSVYPEAGYADVVADVLGEWRSARDRAADAGLDPRDVWLDPGLGFAKNARQSFELLARLAELTQEGVPVVVGPSRKSFIASVDGAPPAERLGGTVAACLAAVERGARVLRVHDVLAVGQALAVARLARRAPARAEAPHA